MAFQPAIVDTVREYPNCYFYANGDPCSPPSKICISSRVKTFDSLKDEITSALNKYTSCTGPVRHIYNLEWAEVTSLDQFKDEASYVAVFGTRADLRKLAYTDIPDHIRSLRRGRKKNRIKTLTPVEHALDPRYRALPSRASTELSKIRGLRLRVHVNGQGQWPAHAVVVNHRDRNDMNLIITEIEKSIVLPGQIAEIYKLGNQGGPNDTYTEVHGAADIDMDDHLLVLPLGQKLRKDQYPLHGKKDFVTNTAPHYLQYYLHESFPHVEPLTNRKSPHSSPASSPRRKKMNGQTDDEKGQNGMLSSRSSIINRFNENRGLRLRVHENGKSTEPVHTVVVQSRDRKELNRIKKEIEKSMNLDPIDRIYKMGADGKFIEIHQPNDLNMDAHVIVVPRGPRTLRRYAYPVDGLKEVNISTAPHALQPYLYTPFPDPGPLTCQHKVHLPPLKYQD